MTPHRFSLAKSTVTRTVAAAALLLCNAAHADVVDFEDVLPGIYAPGESFLSGGYTFTSAVDGIGVVDSSEGFYSVAPSGNDTTAYFGLNDGHLVMSRSDGNAFAIHRFDAGFVAAQLLPAGTATGSIVLSGRHGDGGDFEFAFDFPLVSDDFISPFATFQSTLLTNIAYVGFYACSYNLDGDCVNSNDYLSQFSLDNLVVTAVPETSTLALMSLGLAALAFRRRHSDVTRSSARSKFTA